MAKATKKSAAADEEQVDTTVQPEVETAENLQEPTDSLDVAEGTEGVNVGSLDIAVRVGEDDRRVPVEEKVEVHATTSDPHERQVVVADRRRTRNDNTGETVIVQRTDTPSGVTRPVRIVQVRAHPEVAEGEIGKASSVDVGGDNIVVGQQLSLEQINRYSQKQAQEAAKEDDKPITMAAIGHLLRRRGRSLR